MGPLNQRWHPIRPTTRHHQPANIQLPLALLRTHPALMLTKPLMSTLQINTQQQQRLQQRRQQRPRNQLQLLPNTQRNPEQLVGESQRNRRQENLKEISFFERISFFNKDLS